jgi:putative phage-type endonuclease
MGHINGTIRASKGATMPIIYDVEQLSGEWLTMRCGSCTSSRLNDALAKLKRKDGESAARSNYRKELVVERLTGRTAEHYVNDAMMWGIEQEPIARAEYELATGQEVRKIGLAMHPRIKWFSASTDGLVGDDGILEIKNLSSINHLDILVSGEIPVEYHWQMLGGIACAERKWCDFVSFDSRMPEGLQLFVKRFEYDQALISAMELEVEAFLAEVEKMTADVRAKAKQAVSA